MLYAAAVNTVRKWKYKPFMKGQETINVATNAKVTFSLNQGVGLNSSN